MQKSLLTYVTQSNILLFSKATAAILATILLFSRDLTIIFTDALQSETATHTLAIPFLFAYLIFRKRKMLRAVMPLEGQNKSRRTRHLTTIAGILLSITAVLLYWYGSYTFTPIEYHLSTLPIFAAGLTLIFFNLQTLRELVFPIAFLIFLTPPPFETLYGIGSVLSVLSSTVSNGIINTIGIPSTIISEYGNPTIIITRSDGATVPFTVDIACSGIYSLIGFVLFAAFVAYVIRDKPWKRIALLAVGAPLIYLINILRITLILLIGYYSGEETALQVFHLFGGWVLIFLGTLLLLLFSEKILHTKIFAKPPQKCPECNPKPPGNHSFCYKCGTLLKYEVPRIRVTDIVKIATILASIALLASTQTPVFALAQNSIQVRVDTPAGEQTSEILPQIQGYDLLFAYRDTGYETRAGQDLVLVYVYAPTDPNKIPILVTIGITSKFSSLHKWDACLKQAAKQILLKDVQLTVNPPIIGRFFVFQYATTDEMQATLYWVESATFNVNETTEQKLAIISLIVPTRNQGDLPRIESQMLTAATVIAEYWQPIKIWSQIVTVISQKGLYLAATTGTMIVAIVAMYGFDEIRQRQNNMTAYGRLSETNRDLIDAIRKTEKQTMPTLDNITSTLEQEAEQTTDKEQVKQSLSALERIGIIRSIIANNQDQPVQAWKTRMTLIYRERH